MLALVPHLATKQCVSQSGSHNPVSCWCPVWPPGSVCPHLGHVSLQLSIGVPSGHQLSIGAPSGHQAVALFLISFSHVYPDVVHIAWSDVGAPSGHQAMRAPVRVHVSPQVEHWCPIWPPAQHWRPIWLSSSSCVFDLVVDFAPSDRDPTGTSFRGAQLEVWVRSIFW